jgi:hypothetical protein
MLLPMFGCRHEMSAQSRWWKATYASNAPATGQGLDLGTEKGRGLVIGLEKGRGWDSGLGKGKGLGCKGGTVIGELSVHAAQPWVSTMFITPG